MVRRLPGIFFLCPQRNFGRHIVIVLSVHPSVSLCVLCISPIFFEVGILKFGVWMHLGMAECRVPFSGHCDLDLDLWLSFYSNNNVRPSVPLSCPVHISYIFWGRNSKLMCGCIFGWRSVAYNFWVTVTLTLTSDLVFRIIVSGAYLLHYLR